MKAELQKQLFDRYLKVFGDHTKPITQTCMCWGLEIEDSWYDIIDILCSSLTYTYSNYEPYNETKNKVQ